MAQVLLKGVEKVYANGFKAVHGINLDVKDGEFMVFVGPSGCAKSTTLRMIAGLEEISGGEVWIGNRVVNDVLPKDRGIAMVFQNYALYPHMTVYGNMAFGLELQKMPKAEIKQRVWEAAEKLEITDLLDRKPKQLSGGQRQRVALGRAIVRKPDVFLFDEPLSNLDAKLRVSMRVRIAHLHKELKSTMIYVTHDQVEAMTMGDRICVLSLGRIMQVDTPMNLYDYPANKFVAGFIGSPAMNIRQADLVSEGTEVFVKIGDVKLPLPANKAEKVRGSVGKKVWFGVRPEHISVRPFAESKSDEVKGVTSITEQMGSEAYVYFSAGGVEWISRMEAHISREVKQDTPYTFYFNIENCHIFDFETEQNISL